MSILIGADLVPTETNYDLFRLAEVEKLVGTELKEMLSGADYRIFNLEVPVTDVRTPIDKCGPNLIAPKNTISGIKAIGVDLFSLANNHIMDQGEQGLVSTCNLLQDNEISYVGAGDNLSEAEKAYTFILKGKKIGVYACSEHEFSIAGKNTPGANSFDMFKSPAHVKKLKQDCDYVIVLYHGGKEHYRYPSPYLQKVCRNLVEQGADIVICQHSHCIGCKEEYKGGTIVYGQGNFLFDNSKSEYWQTGLLVQIHDDFEITYIPIIKNNNTVRLAATEQANKILGGFEERSQKITNEDFVEQQYAELAKSMINMYLCAMSGLHCSLAFRVLNKLSGQRLLTWRLNRKYKKERLLAVCNYLECEAHRELFLAGVKGKM